MAMFKQMSAVRGALKSQQRPRFYLIYFRRTEDLAWSMKQTQFSASEEKQVTTYSNRF